MFDAFSNTLLLLQAGADGAALWRWSMILDMFGYYLLLTPLTLMLWCWLKPQNPEWVGLFTLCLLAYILIGAMGALVRDRPAAAAGHFTRQPFTAVQRDGYFYQY